MALDPNNLKDQIDLILTNHPTTVAETGEAWADAIRAYSEEGTVNSQSIGFSDTNRDAFALAFSAAVTVPGTATQAATGIQTGLDTFWNASPVTPNQSGPAAPGGSAALKNALETIFLVPSADRDAKSTAIATAIDLYTKAVVISINLPPVTAFNVE